MKYLILLLMVISAPLMAQNELLAKFGSNGKVKDSLSGNPNYAIEEIRLFNNYLYALVSTVGGTKLGIVSYDSEGNPNTSFSGDGKQEHSYFYSVNNPHMAMADNGDIYLVSCSTFVLEIVKYNIEGKLQTSFGTGGKLSLFSAGGQLAGAEIRDNILIVGCCYSTSAFVVHVDLTKAALETTYGSGGKASITFPSDSPYMSGMTMDESDNVYLFGYINYSAPTSSYAAVAKFTKTGVATNFGTNGVAKGGLNFTFSDGKVSRSNIYAVGTGMVNSSQQGIITAFDANNGNIQTDFSNTGTHDTGPTNTYEYLNCIIILSNGNLLAAGRSMDFISYDDNAYYVQLSPSGAPIIEYGTNGVFIDNTPLLNETVYAMVEVNGYDIISGGISGGRYYMSYLYEESATPEFPQAFSPNNDGSNDYLLIRNLYAATNNTLTVYDREGNRVYEQENYDNSWNGLNNNEKPVSDGIYYYVFKYGGAKKIKNFLEIRR